MRLQTCLVFLLAPFCIGQEEDNGQRAVRAPQGHIQYDDSNGYRVSWKLFAPYTQWTPELEVPQGSESKSEQAETVVETKATKPHEAAAPAAEKHQQVEHLQKPPIEPAVEYKPYSMVPTYIKHLIFKMYEPQGPYVDPKVYIYHTPSESSAEDKTHSAGQSQEQEKSAERRHESISAPEEALEQKYSYSEQETASQQQVPHRTSIQEISSEESTSKIASSGYQNPIVRKKTQVYSKYPLKEIGQIEYQKEDSELKSGQYGFVPPQQQKVSHVPESVDVAHAPQENLMPTLIQQLLNLQAQIPYYVIANRINYKPKKMFIPKPISEDEKGAYTYRSKVYYMRDEEDDQENKEKVTKDTPRH